MYQIHITSSMGNLPINTRTIGVYLLSILSMYVGSFIILNIVHRPVARVISSIIFLLLFNLQISYHFASNQLFDWSFFIDNIDILFYRDSAYTIIHSLDLPTLIYGPVLCLILLLVDIKKKVIRSQPKDIHKRHIVYAMVIYSLIIWMPVRSYDPSVSLFRSIIFYYNSPVLNSTIIAKKNNNDFFPSKNTPSMSGKKPHVFLILVESFNANYFNIVDKDQQPVTPFLNQLKKEALSVEYFYGNSVQTAKGMAAALFSTYPSFSGKLFVKFKGLTLDSPFDVLKPHGYLSLFYLGHSKLKYDNREGFLIRHNIDLTTTVYDVIDNTDRDLSTMWGIRDDRLIKHFFNYFDQTTSTYKDKSIFSVILTSQSHVPFILPKHMRKAFPNANTIQENYANCLQNIDLGIKRFFKELDERGLRDNSIVIITADHAFPMGEHGITSLEAGIYEESYRIPFLLVAPGLSKKELKGPFSQVDIMPTVFDLLNITKKNSMFIGRSIFSKKASNVSVQIQPYEKQISIVKLPLKYRYSVKNNKEYVVNLLDDPLEENNIINSVEESELDEFRERVRDVYATQKYYEQHKKK